MKKIITRLVFYFLLFLSTHVAAQNSKDIFTMFYNVENFFDTINDPETNDEEFIPLSKKGWDTKKYNHKKNQLIKIFSSINNNQHPNLIGLCEIENKEVIEDLLKDPFFKNNNYTIVHKESPDQRGIDCALLFDEHFKLIYQDFIELEIPELNKPTRDIVYAKLKLNQEVIHVFVNHWPSRWGGEKETEYKRVFAASTLKDYIDKNIEDDEFIIIMGDFNDYPSNKSIQDILVQDDLTNLCTIKESVNKGSYNWDDQWGFLDQIIVSNNFLSKDSRFKAKDFDVLNEQWMLYTKKNGIQCPSRTFGGNNWYGGFSDHLPVYYIFSIE